MTTCHKYASECVNHAFYAECICDYGYAGNGKEYCDGKLIVSFEIMTSYSNFVWSAKNAV